MKFWTTFIISLLTLGVVASPQPAAEAEDDEARHPRFHLRTKLLPNQPAKERFDGKFVELVHINADWQELIIRPGPGDLKFFLNGTKLQLPLNPPTPFGVQLAEQVYEAWWQTVEIHAGYGYGNFFLDGNELKARRSWGGWRVCEWWHNKPQLFWIYKPMDDWRPAKDPSSCADVKLIKVPVE